MKRINVVLAVAVALLIGVVGCKSNQTESSAPSPHSQAPQSPADAALSGKVVETMNAAGYTYLGLESGGKKIWVAIPETQVKVGQNVTCAPGMVMTNFTSKTLKRTFDSIVFSSGIL